MYRPLRWRNTARRLVCPIESPHLRLFLGSVIVHSSLLIIYVIFWPKQSLYLGTTHVHSSLLIFVSLSGVKVYPLESPHLRLSIWSQGISSRVSSSSSLYLGSKYVHSNLLIFVSQSRVNACPLDSPDLRLSISVHSRYTFIYRWFWNPRVFSNFVFVLS